MQYYKRETSGKPWHRNPMLSFFFLLRDLIIFLLPIKRLPRISAKILYGVDPKFIFFVHARRLEDIYIALPFLVPVRRLLGRAFFLKILRIFPPFTLGTIKTRQGIHGLVTTSIFPSEILLKDRRLALKAGARGLWG